MKTKHTTILILAFLVINPSILISQSTLTPTSSFLGTHEYERVGYYVHTAGDVNKDGYDDFIIGTFHNNAGGSDAGATYLILGNEQADWKFDNSLNSADARFVGSKTKDAVGYYLGGDGDVNGDGYDDILIGAAGGFIYVVFGKASVDWGNKCKLRDEADASFTQEAEGDFSAVSVAFIGDMNGDGYDDFICGAPYSDYSKEDAGKAYIILGKRSGWTQNINLADADASFYGNVKNAKVGYSVDGVGDVNKDGIPDFAIGARDEAKVYLFFGRKSVNWGVNCNVNTADVIFSGEPAGDWTGWRVSKAGDVNADGFDDFLIAAPYQDQKGVDVGKVYLILGRSSGWYSNLANADASYIGEAANDNAGWDVQDAGDTNGDGFDDFLIGAWYNDSNGEDAGKMYLITGKSSGWTPNTSLSEIQDYFLGEYAGDYAGYSVSNAGDVNGDGVSDIITSSPYNDQVAEWAGKILLFVSDNPKNQEPQLTVEPTVLDYGYTLTSLTFKISNSGGGILEWSAAENPEANWITIVGNNSGNLGEHESAIVQVDITRTGLPNGPNYGEILVTSNAGSQPIDIIVEVGDAPTSPVLSVEPPVLDFNIGLTSLTFTVKNRGEGSLNWSAAENPDEAWITSISPTSGTLTSMQETKVTVVVTRSSLTDGQYTGLITVTSNGGNDNVEIEMIVGDRPPQIRANVGGYTYTTSNQNIFATDRPYHEGAWGHVRGHRNSTASDIKNTTDDVLYQTELFWLDAYRFDLPNGNYTVVLHFAEIYYKYVGGRVFDVYIEDNLVLDHFDIYAEAGFETATKHTFSNIQVTDGRLDIHFKHYKAHAKLSAIEVISEDSGIPVLSVSPTQLDFGASETSMNFMVTNSGEGILEWNAYENSDQTWITSVSPSSGSLVANESQPVTVQINRGGLNPGDYTGTITVSSNGGEQNVTIKMTVVSASAYTKRVNCGGKTSYTDVNNNTWEADKSYASGSWGYVGGSTYSTTDPIANTNDDKLFQSERWGMESYKFDVVNGRFEVKLLFAEIYFKATGKRTFDVQIEGNQVLTDYDIYAEVGHDYATSKIFTAKVDDGQLNINFISHIDDSKISAIQIISLPNDPILSVEPTLLDYGSNETSMTFTVTNAGGGTLSWEAHENPDETWIKSLSPISGSLDAGQSQSVTVTVDRTGLEPGEYTGTITVTSNNGDQNITVQMTVPIPPTLAVSPTSLDFGTTNNSMTFAVTNIGGGSLNWEAHENPDETWITSVSPSSGSLNGGQSQAVAVNVNRSGLEPGEYTGKITVSSNGGQQDITVEMTIPSSPTLSVSPDTLDFGTTITNMTFTVTNVGSDTLIWNAYENPDQTWITSVSPSSGRLLATESQPVTVQISRAGLTPDDYTGTITVSSNGGEQNVVVNMTVVSASTYTKRVNCGSKNSYTDINNNTWEVDQPYASGSWGYVGGSIYSTTDPIANTDDDKLFQSERWGMESYQFDVTNGRYEVKLLFAEIYFTTKGKRVFHVQLEGEQVLTNYDIYAEAGHDNATNKIFTVNVEDGQLNINFIRYIEDPKISAIQIISLSNDPILSVEPTLLDYGSSETSMTFTVTNVGGGALDWEAYENPDESWITSISPVNGSLSANQSETVTVTIDRAGLEEGDYSGKITVASNGGNQDISVLMTIGPTPIYSQMVNCGGSNYTDKQGNLWAADRSYSSGSWGYVGGSNYSTGDPIANTDDDPLYKSERWGLSGYKFDVANGEYEITLLFAEIYFKQSGKRVFHVDIEGVRVLSNFDIFAEVGHDYASNKTFSVNVSDNQLNINFIASVEDPKISAIKVISKNQLIQTITTTEPESNEQPNNIPEAFTLYQNYPNPFNPSTTISFDLPFPASIRLNIFNILGQKINTLIDGNLSPGIHKIVWYTENEDGIPLPSGVYIYQIEVSENSLQKQNKFMVTKRMILKK